MLRENSVVDTDMVYFKECIKQMKNRDIQNFAITKKMCERMLERLQKEHMENVRVVNSKKIVCPSCNYNVDKTFKYCKMCGQKINFPLEILIGNYK